MSDKKSAADMILDSLQREAETAIKDAIYKGVERQFYNAVKKSIKDFPTTEYKLAILRLQQNVIDKLIIETEKEGN